MYCNDQFLCIKTPVSFMQALAMASVSYAPTPASTTTPLSPGRSTTSSSPGGVMSPGLPAVMNGTQTIV